MDLTQLLVDGDLLRACSGRQPLKDTRRGDGDAKHHALHESGVISQSKESIEAWMYAQM